jgi:monofunctional biosynthetic peptidoglycan transglycosylase
MAPRSHGFGASLIKWVALAALACVLVAALAVLSLRWLDPPTSAFMLHARMQAQAAHERGYRTRYSWVSLEQISPDAAIAVIASEDQQFPFHAGFDLRSIREAVRSNASGKRVRGASTITQQVAKNLFLWPGQSYLRKAIEAGLTVLIEAAWPKERILEMYLNLAEFGHGVYGVEAAAQVFFHQPASRLTRSEAALLAAVLPNPRVLHIERPSAYLRSRQEWILGQMRQLGGPAYLQEIEANGAPPRGH